MEDNKKVEKSGRKMKYVEPELVPLDQDQTVEGGTECRNGSGELALCVSGASVLPH